MSTKFTIAALEGDRTTELAEIFDRLNYTIVDDIRFVDSYDAWADEVFDSLAVVGGAVQGNWTILSGDIDSLAVMFLNDESASLLSREKDMRIFISWCIGTVGNYGYQLVTPTSVRYVDISDCDITCEGPAINGEPKIDEEYCEDDLFEVMNLLGFDASEAMEGLDSYFIADVSRQEPPQKKRPWWQFWAH